MGTQITFRRGSSFPTAGSGITLAEPVFETTLHTFHIGLGHGVTAEWVGAPISGLSADIGAGITYKIPTAASVLNYISGLCFGITNGVRADAANTFTALQSFGSGISASGITVNGNMSVTGNFTVSGGVTFTTSETVLIEDNIITLNSNVTGSPSENAGIEIERGTSANVQLLWNESSDRWTFTNDGSTYYDLPTSVVTSFNGNTGAVTGASLGANTFTGLNSFNAGLCASGITLTGSIGFTGSDTKEIVSRTATLTIRGVTSSGSFFSDNAIVLPTDNTGMSIRSFTGIVDFTTYSMGVNPGSAGLRLNSSDGDLINGSVNIWAAGGSITEGRTLSVPDASGTIALTSQLMGAVNGSTAATTAVTSFNGRTGAVQGVSSAAAGTGISVSAATGAIIITNVGVQSFNGNTGAVTGASLGANTFTGLNTFNAGVTTSFLYASTGSTFGSTLQVNGGATFAGRVDVGGILDVVGGTTFESTTDHAGVARFASGVTISGTLNGATATFSRWLSAPAGISTQSITSRGSSLSLAGLTSGVISSGSQIILPVADGIQLNGYGGAVALSSLQAGSVSYNTSLKFMSEDTLNEIYGSVTLTPPSYTDGDYTLYLPNTANGTLALTSQLMGAVNGSTAATTAVTSFNGRTGAVQGVSSAAAGTGISVSAATGAVTITNTGVQSFNGNTGAVTGASLGANTFTGLNTFNAGISAAGGVTFGGTVASDTGYRITSNAINAQTGTTYTFLDGDNGKVVTFNNGSAVTVTIPTGLPVGFNCTAIQLGAGQVGFTAESGVTLQSYGSQYRLIGQHASASIIEYSANIVNLSGNLVV
jgi:ribosomal protein L21E